MTDVIRPKTQIKVFNDGASFPDGTPVPHDGGNGSTYDALILSDGPLRYYPLNDPGPTDVGGTPVIDLTGNEDAVLYDPDAPSNPKVLTQQPSLLAGDPDAFSMFFPGSGSNQKRIEHSIVIPSTQQSFSIELWIRPTTGNAGFKNIFSQHNGTNPFWYNIWLLTDSNADQFRHVMSAPSDDLTSPLIITPDTTYHLVYARDPARQSIYIDGVENIFNTTVPAYTGSVVTAPGNWVGLGAHTTRGTPGMIAFYQKLAIYDRALTSQEVFEHYTVGSTPI